MVLQTTDLNRKVTFYPDLFMTAFKWSLSEGESNLSQTTKSDFLLRLLVCDSFPPILSEKTVLLQTKTLDIKLRLSCRLVVSDNFLVIYVKGRDFLPRFFVWDSFPPIFVRGKCKVVSDNKYRQRKDTFFPDLMFVTTFHDPHQKKKEIYRSQQCQTVCSDFLYVTDFHRFSSEKRQCWEETITLDRKFRLSSQICCLW